MMALLFLSVIQPVAADVVVIVNLDNPVDHLTREQVIDIYMGRYTHFPNGQIAAPIDMDPESPVRVAYYQKLVNKTVAQINSFWARLLFTGRATPPQVAPDAKAVTNVVMHNRGAIGYVDSLSLNDNVKVVYRLP
ncbi:hypothetical protein [Sulfuriferula thiophila]|uniref:hypothetical protein n=1 Tax=Sulfuriferula thiophila TaxID=1781211 RepID=UPI000F60F0B4|nr:hypothetical protein [Sulfuriferula thiophila]